MKARAGDEVTGYQVNGKLRLVGGDWPASEAMKWVSVGDMVADHDGNVFHVHELDRKDMTVASKDGKPVKLDGCLVGYSDEPDARLKFCYRSQWKEAKKAMEKMAEEKKP